MTCTGTVTANVALTVVASLRRTTHTASVPAHPESTAAPGSTLQPMNVAPAFGVAFSSTSWPAVSVAEQAEGHSIPAGVSPLATLPNRPPTTFTLKDTFGATSKTALTRTGPGPLITTAQLACVPAHPEATSAAGSTFQPANTDPAAGVSLNATVPSSPKDAEQTVPHWIPAGELATAPEPAPPLATSSSTGVGVNVALTLVASLTLTSQTASVPAHPDTTAPAGCTLQPANVEPARGVSCRLTSAPAVKPAEQRVGHSIPAGCSPLSTDPDPDPASFTPRNGLLEASKVPVTRTGPGAPITSVQVDSVPVQPERTSAPGSTRQPENTEPDPGVSVNVTVAPPPKDAEQTPPQSIPAGELESEPEPEPAVAASNNTEDGVNDADTLVASLNLTSHSTCTPAHPETIADAGCTLQPANPDPASGASRNVTTLPCAKPAEHTRPHSTPAGTLVIIPEPKPPFSTSNATEDASAKLAVTLTGSLPLTVHTASVPAQPDTTAPAGATSQPVKLDPAAAFAVNATASPLLNSPEHTEGQSIPAGTLDTDPEPDPASATLTGYPAGAW